MFKARNNILLFLLIAPLMALLLLRSQVAAEAVRQGLTLCAQSLLPALFPFFVAVSWAVNCGLFHTLRSIGIPAPAAVFFLGALGGYPLGARTVGEAYGGGLLTKHEAEHLLACCNNAGPAFILVVVGQNVFRSTAAGLALWGIHLTAALIIALLFCRRQTARTASPPPTASPAAAFIAAVGSAAETMVRLCAFVVFFTVVMALLSSFLGSIPPLLAGFLELTVGVTALTPHRMGFTLAAGMLGWGGVSVHCQAAAVLSDTDLSLRYYLLGKALQGILSAAAAWWVYLLL